jgi:hypothetical protein
MPVEVVIKDEEIAIYIDRGRMKEWLKGDPPWEGDGKTDQERQQEEVDKRAEELRKEDEKEGYKTGDGEKKDFPNPVDKKGDTDGSQVQDEDMGERPDTVNLFDVGPNGVGGTLQDDAKGKDKIKDMRDWLKKEKFNYKNFCVYLYQLKEVAGFKLSTPVIGLTQKKEPSIFQLAVRFHSYWMSAKEYIAGDYKTFLISQLADMGITIQMVKDELDGEEIDPKNLPKGIEVSV